MRHYLIVRSDLTHGQAAAQLAHAAHHSVESKLPRDTHVVVLAAKDTDQLLWCQERLKRLNIAHELIVEPDMGDQPTAIGIYPILASESKSVRTATRKLKLFNGGSE